MWTDGYTFLGWYTTKTGSTKLSETDIVKTAADKTYYAKWQANKYTVTFAMNGGTASTHSKQVTFGSSYSTLTAYPFLSAKLPARPRRWLLWYTSR